MSISFKKGCLWLIGIAFCLFLIAAISLYAVIFHSSWPVQFVTASINNSSSNQQVQLVGVEGTLASGFSAEKLLFEDGESVFAFDNVAFRYSSFWDPILFSKFTIEEISAERIDVVLGADESAMQEPSAIDPASSVDFEMSQEIQFEFRLDQFKLADIHLRKADGSWDIRIPLIELKGLYATQDIFELDLFEVQSEAIDLKLVEARSPFQQSIEGVVTPFMHCRILSDINFEADFYHETEEGTYRFAALGGAVESSGVPDVSTALKIQDLELSKYIDISDTLLPDDISLVAEVLANEVKIETGSFMLGKTRFECPPQTLLSWDPTSRITAVAEVESQKVTVYISHHPEESWPYLKIDLTSEGEEKTEQLIAQVYFGKNYNSLDSAQKAFVSSVL